MADVVGWTGELLRMQALRQQTFAKDYEHFLRQLSKVADTERRVQVHERALAKLEEKECRLAKQFRRRGDHESRAQLDRAAGDREEAAQQLAETRAEAEVVKMIQLRDGLMGLADAQRALALATHQIFSCQRELAEFVPAVSTKDIRQMRYEGVPHTRERVAELRRSLTAGELQMPFNAPSSVERRQQVRRSEPPNSTSFFNGNSSSGENGHLRGRFTQQQSTANSADQRHHRSQHRQQQSVHPLGTPPPPYTPTAQIGRAHV